MRLTSEEFDALKRLIWNCIERHAEAPIYSTDKLNRLQGQEADARAVLCGAQPQAEDGRDAAKPGDIEVAREQMMAGRAAFNKTYTSGDEQLAAVYRAMRAAEPTRPVTGAEVERALMRASGLDPDTIKPRQTYVLCEPSPATMRAALEDFAKRRGI